jgi:uncharacterized membrane protein YfhO
MTLTFAPSDRARHLLITQWYQQGWRVDQGGARIVRAAEQLVGLEIPAGEQRVTIEYLPIIRATLFFVGIGTELIVLGAIGWLSLRRRAAVETRLSSAAVGRELAK